MTLTRHGPTAAVVRQHRRTSRPAAAVPVAGATGTATASGVTQRVTADEAEEPALRIGVAWYVDPRAVLAGRAHRVLEVGHATHEQCAEFCIEPVVLAGRPREIPGVHEDVGRVELVDRPVQRYLADVRVLQETAGGGRVVEHPLDGVALHHPGGHRVLVDAPAVRK